MSKKEYPAKLTTGYYRVREVWEDEASQFGAYRLLANAKAKCDENPGSRVFDNDGTRQTGMPHLPRLHAHGITGRQ